MRAAFRAGTGMPYSNYTGGGTAETHRSDIGGLNLSTRPAVMIETGNMRSSVDAAADDARRRSGRRKPSRSRGRVSRRYVG